MRLQLLYPAGVYVSLLLLLSVSSAQAQAGIALASLQVELWPEFDQPVTLVILDGRLESDVPLPAELTVHIPAAAGGPHAVATYGPDGSLLNTPFSTATLGDTIVVTLTTNATNFRVEYYDPALNLSGEARNYHFQWTPDYVVRAATLRVQQPAGAWALSAEPALQLQGSGEYGLSYHIAELGALEAGQPVVVRLSYSKSDEVLSADAIGANVTASDSAQTSPTGAAPSAASPSAFLPWLIGGAVAGLALVGAGAFWYGLTRRKENRSQGVSHKRRARLQHEPEVKTTSTTRFCTGCGQPAQPGDQFCRKCGTKLRA